MSFGKRELDRSRPEIDFPGDTHPRPSYEDIIQGTGKKSPRGAYLMSLCRSGLVTGAEFDASWNRGQPRFTAGIGQVITGWDQGLLGMKAGGRRRLEIPPHLAYGENGAGADIGPNETLIFVVDLVEVRS